MNIYLTEAPRKLYLYASILGLLISVACILNILVFKNADAFTDQDLAQISILVPVLLTSLLALFFRRVSAVISAEKRIDTYYLLGAKFLKKSYSFDSLSSIYIRTEYARHQGADLSSQANTSFGVPMYILIVDLKGFGRDKKRIRLNRYFDKETARKDKNLLIKTINEKSNDKR